MVDANARRLPRTGAIGGAIRVRRSPGALLAALAALALAGGVPPVLAQGGSTGGSIGGSIGGGTGGGNGGSTGGSIGGSITPAPSRTAPRRERPHAERGPSPVGRGSQRAAHNEPTVRRGGGGGGGNFDGVWSVTTSSSCMAGGNSSLRISGTRLYASGASGTVSPSGAVRATGRYNGLTSYSSGHLSGNSGGGSFRRADGCTGTWTAYRSG